MITRKGQRMEAFGRANFCIYIVVRTFEHFSLHFIIQNTPVFLRNFEQVPYNYNPSFITTFNAFELCLTQGFLWRRSC